MKRALSSLSSSDDDDEGHCCRKCFKVTRLVEQDTYEGKEHKDYFCDHECQLLYYDTYLYDTYFIPILVRTKAKLLTRSLLPYLLVLQVLTGYINDISHAILYHMFSTSIKEIIHSKDELCYKDESFGDFTIFRNHYGIFLSGRSEHLKYIMRGEFDLTLNVTEPFQLFKTLEFYNMQFISNSHCFFMSPDNGLYVAGQNEFHQLGLPNSNHSLVKMKNMDNSSRFKHHIPVCGAKHTLWCINGELYGVGDNSKGQLGLHQTLIKEPTRILYDYHIEEIGYVTKVICGDYYTIIGTRDNIWYATGRNVDGQLGLGDCLNRRRFTKIEALNHVSTVIDIQSKHNRTFFIVETTVKEYDSTRKGYYVLACGNNAYGCLGIAKEELSISTPQRIVVLENDRNRAPSLFGDKPIINSSHNHFTSIHLSNKSLCLWTCGNNNSFQLGLRHTNRRHSFCFVHCTPSFGKGSCIKQVELGTNHMLVLFDDGILQGCGSNEKGQLGVLDHPVTKLTTLPLIPSEKIRELYHGFGDEGAIVIGFDSVSSTFDSTIVKTFSNHHTFATGYNGEGQLGLGDREDRHNFTLVTFPSKLPQLEEGFL